MKVEVHPNAWDELNKLEEESRKKFLQIIDLLVDGVRLARTEYKLVVGTKAMFELRVKASSGIYRAIGSRLLDGSVLLVFFKKKSMRIPRRMLKTAQKRIRTYLDGIKE